MHKATIHVYSALGHTPLTGRIGAYYDLLALVDIQVEDPEQARRIGQAITASIPNARSYHFDVPTHPNQSTRCGFITL